MATAKLCYTDPYDSQYGKMYIFCSSFNDSLGKNVCTLSYEFTSELDCRPLESRGKYENVRGLVIKENVDIQAHVENINMCKYLNQSYADYDYVEDIKSIFHELMVVIGEGKRNERGFFERIRSESLCPFYTMDEDISIEKIDEKTTLISFQDTNTPDFRTLKLEICAKND